MPVAALLECRQCLLSVVPRNLKQIAGPAHQFECSSTRSSSRASTIFDKGLRYLYPQCQFALPRLS